MSERVYSPRLGSIADRQFDAALQHHALGRYVRAEPAAFGNFGMVVFVTSTMGEFVFRGAPLWPRQFRDERFWTRLLHQRTDVPVPWPYVLDEDAELFGYPYVLMPRMPGLTLEDERTASALSVTDWRQIGAAIGRTLAATQTIQHPAAAQFDADTEQLRVSDAPWATVLADRTERLIDRVLRLPNGDFRPDDASWLHEQFEARIGALEVPHPVVATLDDYQEHNVVVTPNPWRVSGVFDIQASFGDGLRAAVRQFSMFAERIQDAAHVFLAAFLAHAPQGDRALERFEMYVLLDALLIWEWAKRLGRAWWDPQLTFRDRTAPFLERATEGFERAQRP